MVCVVLLSSNYGPILFFSFSLIRSCVILEKQFLLYRISLRLIVNDIVYIVCLAQDNK